MRPIVLTCLRALAALAALAIVSATDIAGATGYPSKAIRLVVPYPAGGGIDLVARIIQDKLAAVLGEQIVIENRPGASGAVGAQIVAKAEPDGYTLLFCAGDFITIPQLMPQMTFSPMQELLPVAMVTNSPMVLIASGDAPFSDVKGLSDAARANPNGLSYGTPGQGTINNVVGQWIAVSAHIKMLPVAYRGGPAAAEGVAAGEVPLGVVQPPAVYPGLVGAGKIKVIALTGAERPDFVPSSWTTLAESGLPIDATLWLGLFAPLQTPNDVVARLDQAVGQILEDVDIRRRLNDTGINPQHIGPGAFAKKIRDDAARYDAIIRQAGMHFD
ncbi:MAG TPA: tripartite tricarboxylate transporter substrate-binding protein [Xanthobacteraceae bacterium]|nr:tripartite tricarboxylate transporter substrate-binding protein [Xanthobacteraceae bacterium]